MLSRRAMCSMPLLVSLAIAIAFACTPAHAVSSGGLGSCDLTPVGTWPNGCMGFDTWTRSYLQTCQGNSVMRWATSPRPSTVYTLRAGDGADPKTDLQSYTPGGGMTELHVRTYDLSLRYIGFLLYATNGTDPKTKKETQVGSWQVIPAAPGFQVPSTCGYTAVTHDGADVKPIHARFYFSAPVGTGTVRFRILLKQGIQGRGNFWYPAQNLTLTEGKPLTMPPQNTPAVWGTKIVNGTSQNVIIKPAVVVPIASGAEQRVPILGALGQTCADACAQQLPATPFCHRQAGANIASSSTLLSAVGLQARCSLPVLAGCPYEGAAHVTQSATRTTCSFRSRDAKSTCPGWALPASLPSTLFDSGATGSTDRSSALYVADVCFTSAAADSQNVCVCTNNVAAQGSNPFSQAAIAAAAVPKSTSKAAAAPAAAAAARRLMQADSRSAAAVAAGHSTGSLALLTLLAAVVGGMMPRGSGSKQSMLALLAAAVLLVCLLSSPVSAHNYMRSVHRATAASVTKPCQTRLTNDPHVQIVKDQIFELSFTNGHGVNEGFRKTYFAILHSSDYDQLSTYRSNITDIFRDYLNMAPASAFRSSRPDAAMWERQHQRRAGEPTGLDSNWKNPKGLAKNDSVYIALDPVMEFKATPISISLTDTRAVVNLQVHPDLMAAYGPDRRAAYYNAKYPWLETVDEFMNPYNRDGSEPVDFYSHQHELIRANFTARKGPGNYIVWYSWSGYGDCVDVNVLPGTTPVVNRYGTIPADGAKKSPVKLEHAEIRYVTGALTPLRIVDPVTRDASQCIADCLASRLTCTMVQVVRAQPPAGSMGTVANIPWVHFYMNATASDRGEDWACKCYSVSECVAKGCKRTSLAQSKAEGWVMYDPSKQNDLSNTNADPANFANLQPDSHVCYGAAWYRNQDLQVDEDYYLADDPIDPAWYSTVYMMLPTGGFLNIPAMPDRSSVDFINAERCLTCSYYTQAGNYTTKQAAAWAPGLQPTSADMCADCDLVVSAQPTGAATRAAKLATLSGADAPFVGYNATVERAAYAAALAAAAATPSIQPAPVTPKSSTGSSAASKSSTGRSAAASSTASNAAGTPAAGGSDNAANGQPDGTGVGADGAAAAGGSSSSSSSSMLFGLGKLPSILVLVAICVGGLIAVAGVVVALRVRAARRSSNSDLSKMKAYMGSEPHTELQANPAVHANFVQW